MHKRIIKQRRRIFFSGEGLGERNYGQVIRSVAKIKSANVFIDCKATSGGDPLAIVRESVKYYTSGVKNHGTYKHGIIMLDSDTLGINTLRDDQIPGVIGTLNINLFYNDPNFEAFLLHHFIGHENDSPTASQTMDRLRTVFPNYEKNIDARRLFSQFGIEGMKLASSVTPSLKELLETLNIDLN